MTVQLKALRSRAVSRAMWPYPWQVSMVDTTVDLQVARPLSHTTLDWLGSVCQPTLPLFLQGQTWATLLASG